MVLKRRDSRTVLADLYQEGTAKVRVPNVPLGAPLEAILINTGGGMTGGDSLSVEVALRDSAAAVVTTQACEKIYRARDGVATIDNHVVLEAGARLDWVPQETILFDGSALRRRFCADMSSNARLLAVESIVLGRTARGETVDTATIHDAWRIRRDGRLVWADAFHVSGPVAALLRTPATGGGMHAMASIVLISPDAEARLDGVRGMLAGMPEASASAWNGLLLIRVLAPDGAALRRTIVTVLGHILRRALPRVWTC